VSRGGDSQDALRKVWMEGYERGKRDASAPPVVVIDTADLAAVYSHPCDHPDECPACKRKAPWADVGDAERLRMALEEIE